MLITFRCEKCQTNLEVNASLAGSDIFCPQCQASLVVPRQEIGPGTTIGGFEIKEILGRGGMGEVYLARQHSMSRDIALKILPPQLTRDPGLIERFLNEVKLAARLEHPHLVTAFEAGEDNGIYFMAMSYVRGLSLEQKLRQEGAMKEKDALRMVRQVATALAYAWDEHHLLHRDIKPSNILLDHHGAPKLTDLGLSKSLNEPGLTLSAMLIGTPNYMSPEQAEGQLETDCRADMYSLGATLYHMVTGKMPFESSSLMDTLRKQVKESLPDPRTYNPDISAACVDLLEVMLAKNPEHRHSNWPALIADLDQVLAGSPPSRATLAGGESLLRRVKPTESQKIGVLRESQVRKLAEYKKEKAQHEVEERAKAEEPRSAGLWIGVVLGVVVLAAVIIGYRATAKKGKPVAAKPEAPAAVAPPSKARPETPRPAPERPQPASPPAVRDAPKFASTTEVMDLDGALIRQWPASAGGNGHWYKAVAKPLKWEDARAAAVAAGGYLATVTSAAENQFVFEKSGIRQLQSTSGGFWAHGGWLGARRDDSAADKTQGWKWVTGEPWTFTHWSSGQPDAVGSSDGPRENCLEYGNGGASLDGAWNDAAADQVRPYVVEWDTAPPRVRDALAGAVAGETAVPGEQFIGCWEYEADGVQCLREFREDGTACLYGDGEPCVGWKGFTWAASNGKLIVSRPNGKIDGELSMLDGDTLGPIKGRVAHRSAVRPGDASFSPPSDFKATKEQFVGQWELEYEGRTIGREFAADGTAGILTGADTNGWQRNYMWTFEDGAARLWYLGASCGRYILKDADTLLVAGGTLFPPAGRVGKPIQQTPEGAILLPAKRATIHGTNLMYDTARRELNRWKDDSEWAEWNFEAVKPGLFDVLLDYSCAESGGAEYRIGLGQQTVSGKLASTGSWDSHRTVKAGRLSLEKGGRHTVSLRGRKAGNAVVNTWGMILVPVDGVRCAPDEAGVIRLPAVAATIKGTKLAYFLPWDDLGFWSDDREWAEWTFEAARAGEFDAVIRYGCAPGPAGGEYRLELGDQVLTGMTKTTRTWDDHQPVSVGRLSIAKPGRHTLALRGRLRSGSGALMNVQDITLTPVAGQATAGLDGDAYRQVLSAVADALLRGEVAAAGAALSKAGEQESLSADQRTEMAAMQETLTAVADMPTVILEAFRPEVGQEVSISLKSGAAAVVLDEVTKTGLRAHRVVKVDGQVVGQSERSIPYSELGVKEKIRRLGAKTDGEVGVMKGLVAVEARALEQAQVLFVRSETKLGELLAGRMGEVQGQRKEAAETRELARREEAARAAYSTLLAMAGAKSPNAADGEQAALLRAKKYTEREYEAMRRQYEKFTQDFGETAFAREHDVVLATLRAIRPPGPVRVDEAALNKAVRQMKEATPFFKPTVKITDEGIEFLAAGSLIKDLGPLRGFPIWKLEIQKSLVADLSPVIGMPLRVLNIHSCPVSDLSPLTGMALNSLVLGGGPSQVRDLSPLKGMPLTDLVITDTWGISDLGPLRGMRLVNLNITSCRALSDLSPLQGMPLGGLAISGCDRIKDLTPLARMPLKGLWMDGVTPHDFSPLRGLPLEFLSIKNAGTPDPELLRQIKTLKEVIR